MTIWNQQGNAWGERTMGDTLNAFIESRCPNNADSPFKQAFERVALKAIDYLADSEYPYDYKAIADEAIDRGLCNEGEWAAAKHYCGSVEHADWGYARGRLAEDISGFLWDYVDQMSLYGELSCCLCA